VINYFFYVADEVRELLASAGCDTHLDHIIGAVGPAGEADEMLAHWKAKGLDFTKHLPQGRRAEVCHLLDRRRQNHPIVDVSSTAG
jgi:hypothetical protein